MTGPHKGGVDVSQVMLGGCAEIEAENRRPPAEEAHGVPRRGCAGRPYEGTIEPLLLNILGKHLFYCYYCYCCFYCYCYCCCFYCSCCCCIIIVILFFCGIMVQDSDEFWISKEEYLEEGMRCLKKCGQT